MKRKENKLALKVKFLGITNTRGSRISITQTNNNKNCVIDCDPRFIVIDQIENIIENIKEIDAFSMLVDNTQNNFYVFVLELSNKTSFPDIIKKIKELEKWKEKQKTKS